MLLFQNSGDEGERNDPVQQGVNVPHLTDQLETLNLGSDTETPDHRDPSPNKTPNRPSRFQVTLVNESDPVHDRKLMQNLQIQILNVNEIY